LKELLVSAEKLVKTANGALGSFNTTVASDGPVASELIGALAELSAAARSIRLMAEYLERHPEALIRGKGH
jgi:paraquat-inducible protein B